MSTAPADGTPDIRSGILPSTSDFGTVPRSPRLAGSGSLDSADRRHRG